MNLYDYLRSMSDTQLIVLIGEELATPLRPMDMALLAAINQVFMERGEGRCDA